jgi:hypothetical protein
MALSNAERQKRYRQRQAVTERNEKGRNVTETVTERNGETVTPDSVGVTLIDGVPACVLAISEDSPAWKKDPAYLKHIRHLRETPIEELQAKGVYIPCWRYTIKEKAA